MIISVSETFKHSTQCEKRTDLDQEKLQKTILESIEKVGLNPNDLRWNEQGHLELRQPSSLKLHTLTLQMEKLGLDLKLTKQTLIEIC